MPAGFTVRRFLADMEASLAALQLAPSTRPTETAQGGLMQPVLVAPLDPSVLGESLADATPLPDANPEPPSPLERRFPTKRDQTAWLFEPTHTYVVNGARVSKSVTGLLKKYFPVFNPALALGNFPQWKAKKSSKYGMLIRYLQVVEERDDDYCRQAIAALWKREGELASKLGTDMHRDFQCIVEGNDPPQGETYEVTIFRPWLKTFCELYNLVPWRAEWVIYYEHEGITVVAGQVDLVLKHSEREEYTILDFKRKDPTPKWPGGPRQLLGDNMGNKFGEEYGSGPFHEVPATDFGKYTAQLNTYAHIAATQYGIDFRDRMYLLQVHPSLQTPHIIGVERMDDVMEELFTAEISMMSKSESATSLF